MFKSKTIWVAIAVAVMGVLQQLNITDLVPAEYGGLAVAGLGLVMAGLRMVTTKPLSDK